MGYALRAQCLQALGGTSHTGTCRGARREARNRHRPSRVQSARINAPSPAMSPPAKRFANLLAIGRRPLPISRRRFFTGLGLAAAAGVTWEAWRYHHPVWRDTLALQLRLPTPHDSEAQLARIVAAAAAQRPLFARKVKPRYGEWLAHFEEPGETFNQYLRAVPLSRRSIDGDILVLPLGSFDERLSRIVTDVVALAQLFYGRTVRLLPAQPVPPPLSAGERRGSGPAEQLYSLPLLDLLKPLVPPGAAALLAMTPQDLTPGPGWNYVFGQASLIDRVGVWSLYRLAEARAPAPMQLRRVAQVVLHELGHMFGLRHCTAYGCCMNGSNSLSESDRAPLAFCPECDAKVVWRFGLDPAPRQRRLAAFASIRGLAADAELWSRCAAATERVLGTAVVRA